MLVNAYAVSSLVHSLHDLLSFLWLPDLLCASRTEMQGVSGTPLREQLFHCRHLRRKWLLCGRVFGALGGPKTSSGMSLTGTECTEHNLERKRRCILNREGQPYLQEVYHSQNHKRVDTTNRSRKENPRPVQPPVVWAELNQKRMALISSRLIL